MLVKLSMFTRLFERKLLRTKTFYIESLP